MTPDDVKKALREEMNVRGLLDNDQRAGLAAIVGGESHFIPKFETGYSHTSNERIRMIFPSRIGGMSDAELNAVKATDETWFEFVYSYKNRVGHQLGNTQEGDGFRFRGGGLNQNTGRGNYEKYGKAVGVDLIANPELINTPRIATAVAVEYFKDRFHGGNFNDMKRAFGVSIGEPDAEKNRLYQLYKQTGEWDYRPGEEPVVPAAPEPVIVHPAMDPVVANFLNALQPLEKFLKEKGLYTGPIDNDPGPGLRAGLKAYLRSIG